MNGRPEDEPPSGPRSATQRKVDTLSMLGRPAVDVWVASAGVDDAGVPRAHLVPLALAWVGERVVLALELDSRTARNIAVQGRARLALGPTRDVVMIDAALEDVVPVAEAPAALAEGFAAQADWDPRRSPSGYGYLTLRPQRIQAWRDESEIPARTIMKAGTWLV